MHVAIVGFEVEGRAALAYWQQLGAQVTVCDQDPDKQVPEGIDRRLGEGYLKDLDKFDVIWRTPVIHPDVILRENPGVKDKITSTINEFLRVCPTDHVIGVTGTKGKGTTCTLIAKILEAAGEHVFLGGNIGVSPLEFLPKLTENSWVVLELSSYQLIDLQYGPNIAVCLMVAPEHLIWHGNLDDYILSKARLFESQTPRDLAIYHGTNELSRTIARYSRGLKIPYSVAPGAHVHDDKIVITGHEIVQVDELKLLGKHNWQNVCAAITAAWQITQNVQAIRAVLTTFTGLPHRLELVRALDGVRYYDDSFGTTPETAQVAMEAFQEPKVVILGGSDKGADFDELAHAVRANNVRRVILIGDTARPDQSAAAPKIAQALHAVGFDAVTSLVRAGGSTMADAVQAAREASQPGDIVLLSTGCASFDMFQNYKDRAEQFVTAVQSLA